MVVGLEVYCRRNYEISAKLVSGAELIQMHCSLCRSRRRMVIWSDENIYINIIIGHFQS